MKIVSFIIWYTTNSNWKLFLKSKLVATLFMKWALFVFDSFHTIADIENNLTSKFFWIWWFKRHLSINSYLKALFGVDLKNISNQRIKQRPHRNKNIILNTILIIRLDMHCIFKRSTFQEIQIKLKIFQLLIFLKIFGSSIYIAQKDMVMWFIFHRGFDFVKLIHKCNLLGL